MHFCTFFINKRMISGISHATSMILQANSMFTGQLASLVLKTSKNTLFSNLTMGSDPLMSKNHRIWYFYGAKHGSNIKLYDFLRPNMHFYTFFINKRMISGISHATSMILQANSMFTGQNMAEMFNFTTFYAQMCILHIFGGFLGVPLTLFNSFSSLLAFVNEEFLTSELFTDKSSATSEIPSMLSSHSHFIFLAQVFPALSTWW